MLQGKDGGTEQDHTLVIINAIESKFVNHVPLSRIPRVYTKIYAHDSLNHSRSNLTPEDTHVGRRALHDGATSSEISEILELLVSLDEAEKCGQGESVLR